MINRKDFKRLREVVRKRSAEVGAVPGTITIDKNALKPKITIYSYNEYECVEKEMEHLDMLGPHLESCDRHTHWIIVKGLGDKAFLQRLDTHLGISPLVLEDIVNTYQRPKYEEYGDYDFFVSRYIRRNGEELDNDQVSGILRKKLLITFQEDYSDIFLPVITRIQKGKGFIRKAGAPYLAYAVTDTMIDYYFDLLNKLSDELDELEDRIYERPDRSVMFRAQQIKRMLMVLRRSVWPERDKVNDMIRSNSSLLKKDIRPYLRDAYDHCIQVMDLIENDKEITSSIIDMHLSLTSNRMNEIMKVLTVISSIFIPLTFIAGVYGMNFAPQNPRTGRVLPDNMPELYTPHGYKYVMIAMAVIAFLQILFFWRKGWFNKL
ncbi:MAG: magnesium/cobalt transporter CorA [Mucilaginibacter polytrichastri]|nr:magnesium/cobalt transporter CorA [Mucilaginibacter polytrichastri]